MVDVAVRSICQRLVETLYLTLYLDALKEPNLSTRFIITFTSGAAKPDNVIAIAARQDKPEYGGYGCRVVYLVIAHSVLALELCSLMLSQCSFKLIENTGLLCTGGKIQTWLRAYPRMLVIENALRPPTALYDCGICQACGCYLSYKPLNASNLVLQGAELAGFVDGSRPSRRLLEITAEDVPAPACGSVGPPCGRPSMNHRVAMLAHAGQSARGQPSLRASANLRLQSEGVGCGRSGNAVTVKRGALPSVR